jgi:hypothetical protein
LPVAVGFASGAQVVVTGICQFDALEDPEDCPPSVLESMLSGTGTTGPSAAHPGGQSSTRPPSTCACTCGTAWPASAPVLNTTR